MLLLIKNPPLTLARNLSRMLYLLPIPHQSIGAHAWGIREFVCLQHIFTHTHLFHLRDHPFRECATQIFKRGIGWHHSFHPTFGLIQPLFYLTQMPFWVIIHAEVSRCDADKLFLANAL